MAGVAWAALAVACSSPDEDVPDPPFAPPAFAAAGAGGAPTQPNTGADLPQGVAGTSPVAAGGAAGSPPVAAGGSAGAAGAAGAPTTPPVAGEGLVLRPDANGVVLATTNALGMQGAFYTTGDAGGSTITPASFMGAVDATTGALCVSGTAAQVVAGDFAGIWGTAVGFSVSQPTDPTTGMFMPPQPFSRAITGMGTLSGFSFTLTPGPSGTAVPVAAMRFKTTFPATPGSATESTEQFCLPMTTVVPAGNVYTVSINAQTEECWAAGGAPFASNEIIALQWQVTTNETAAVPFDFCIGNLQAVVTP